MVTEMDKLGGPAKTTDLSWNNHFNVDKQCLMYRIDRLERSQTKATDISTEVEKVINNFDKNIKTKSKKSQRTEKSGKNDRSGKRYSGLSTITTSQGNNFQASQTVTFEDPKREVQYLKKIIKKQGNEIGRDIAKIELIIEKISEELLTNYKNNKSISEKISKLEKEFVKESAPKFGTSQTCREDKENIHTNLADEASKHTYHHRREVSNIDRADLLIMCDKIKDDFQKSLRDSINSHQFQTIKSKPQSPSATQRDHKKELRNSIEKYKSAYGLEVVDTSSPMRRIRYFSTKPSARRGPINSDCSSLGKTLDPRPSIKKIQVQKSRGSNIRIKQEDLRKKKSTLASFSPFSTIKSRYKELESHRKTKKNVSKLDKIYKELECMENDYHL